MIVIALIAAAAVATALGVVVAGIQATDHRKELREQPGYGWADRFARRVLGVYVRQPNSHGPAEGRTRHCQERR
jgi:hypothetical protein